MDSDVPRSGGVAELDPLDRTNTDHGEAAPLTRTEPIGRFLVLRRLGVGGTAVVWSAYDPELDRKVAVKVLHWSKVSDSTTAGDRLRREAQALAKLNHPNVVAIYDAGTCAAPGGGKELFVAEELVEGASVAAWLQQKPRSCREIIEVFVQAGRGLAAAHEAGLVHRDFKPGNVLVGADGRVRVSDFGLARAIGSGEAVSSPPTDSTLDDTVIQDSTPLSMTITEVGAVMGTPAYMAPEQHLGQSVDARADQFSFCVALYEALYGEKPFAGATMEELRLKVLQGKVRAPPKNSRVPAWLRGVLLRGLSVEAQQRFPNMVALLAALQRDPVRRRLFMASAAAVVVVLLGLVGGILVWQRRDAQVCLAEAEEQAGAWNDQSDDAIRKAFEALGRPYALDAYDRVRRSLSAYHDKWVDGYADACAATHVRHAQSEPILKLRRSCLWARRDAMAALITVLAKADEGTVKKAVEAVSSLGSITYCTNVAALSAAVTLPEDEPTRLKVEGLRKDLAQAGAFQAAGSHRVGLDIASATATAARQTGFRPVVAEAMLRLGTLHYALGSYAQAEEDFYQAWWAAEASGYTELEARASSALVVTVGCMQNRLQEGARLGKHARAIIDRFRSIDRGEVGDEVEAEWYAGMGNLAYSRADYDEALDYDRHALALREKAFGGDHPSVAKILIHLTAVLTSKRDYDGALEASRRAIEIQEKRFGPKHPDVALAMSNYGGVLVDRGDLQEGMEYQRRALNIAEEVLGHENPTTVSMLDYLCFSWYRGGDYGKSLECYREILPLKQRSLGEEHPRVGNLLSNISELLRREEKYAEVFPLSTQALRIATTTFGPVHSDVATAHNNLGCAYLATGDPARAIEHLEEAVAICETVECDENIRPEARFALARALWLKVSDRPRALGLARAARDEYAEIRGSEEWTRQVDDWLTAAKAR